MLRCMLLLLLLTLPLAAGCGGPQSDVPEKQQELVLYSELEQRFTEDLLQEFNKKNAGKISVRAVYELKKETGRVDLVLAEQRSLNSMKLAGRLQAVPLAPGSLLPVGMREENFYWYGVFYDPTVFLVNQQFARTIGQSSLKGWKDLENHRQLRVAMENLSDSSSTQNFLGAFADRLGENASLNYLWNLNRRIGQYAKFPFTPVRMAAVGDADVAVTRQSYVFKYLENKFPAYVVYPREGTPVELYGVGAFRECADVKRAAAFMGWLLTDEPVQAVSQADATGFMFLFPSGRADGTVDPQKLWLNKSFLTPQKQEALTARWLELVRFSK